MAVRGTRKAGCGGGSVLGGSRCEILILGRMEGRGVGLASNRLNTSRCKGLEDRDGGEGLERVTKI